MNNVRKGEGAIENDCSFFIGENIWLKIFLKMQIKQRKLKE